MANNILLGLFLVFFPLASFAQVVKCKTPSGRVVISDKGCPGGSDLEKRMVSTPVSIERQRQAAEVAARNRGQLASIENEKATFNRQLQQQAAANAENRVENRGSEQAKSEQQHRDKCLDAVGKRGRKASERIALSELCANPNPSTDNFSDCADRLAKAKTRSERAAIVSVCTGDPNAGARVMEASNPPPMPTPAQGPRVITSCDAGGCWDTGGTRYNGGAGNTMFRQDGKVCQKIGSNLQCN